MSELDELIELLARLIEDGYITEEEAVEVLRYFDSNGELPPLWELPLPITETVPSDLRERIAERLRAFVGQPPVPSPDVAQSRFIDEADALAQQLMAGTLTLKEWQRRMIDLEIDYLARQAADGAQGALVDAEDLFGMTAIQLAFIARLADQTATGRISENSLRARVPLYAGEGRAIFYQQAGLTTPTYGWIEDYIAIDDRNTCGPCSASEAQGPYLPGRGPMPGRICLGRGYCRCLRFPRYDEAAYLRLGGT